MIYVKIHHHGIVVGAVSFDSLERGGLDPIIAPDIVDPQQRQFTRVSMAYASSRLDKTVGEASLFDPMIGERTLQHFQQTRTD